MSASDTTIAAAEALPRGFDSRRWLRSAAPAAISLVAGIGLWYAAAGNLLEFLPTPTEVADEFWAAVSSSEFYADLAVTLRRIVIAWFLALIAATIVGLAMGRNWVAETALNPIVLIGLALPGPVTVLFSILAFGLGETTTLIALWMAVTPFVISFVYNGARNLDESLIEMGRSYGVRGWDAVRNVILPQLAPALMSGARFGFAMSWKLIVLVEALSATQGIGERLEFFFSFNNPEAVIAWTLSFTVVMVLVEVLVFRTISRRLFAWRGDARPAT